ncbi:MAG: FHA domain-containing protein [Cyanobacteria bacterium P01_F01_bin.86]
MVDEPVVIQLSWEDPITGKSHRSAMSAPIAIGREPAKISEQWGNQPVSCLELLHNQVSRYHASITVVNEQLYITDKSANGTFLNGRRVRPDGQFFTSKDTLRIGPFKITATIIDTDTTGSTELNLDQEPPVKPEAEANPNTIVIWLLGGLILLLLGTGIWILAQMLLDGVRPQVEPPSSRLSPGVHNTSEAKHSAYRCWGA